MTAVSKFDWKNNFKAEDAIPRVCLCLLSHPFDYAKILIQLGYEPFPPYISTTIFLRKRLTLPGIFAYLRLIRNEDGILGVYRGLSYKVAFTLLNGFITANGNALLEPQPGSVTEAEKQKNKTDFKKLLQQIKRQTAIRIVALTFTYPLQVLVVRSCAEFIGKETVYSSVISAVQEVYQREGLIGFYGGFIPRLLGECLFIISSQSVLYMIENFTETESSVKTYLATTISILIQSIFYPFHVVSTVMAVNSSKTLIIAQTEPEFLSWIDCWRHLSALGQLKRGSSLLWRYPYEMKRPSPIAMNRPWNLMK